MNDSNLLRILHTPAEVRAAKSKARKDFLRTLEARGENPPAPTAIKRWWG